MQTAASIEHRTARALYALLELSKSLSAQVQLDGLLRTVEEAVPPIVHADSARLVLVEEEESDPAIPRALVNRGSTLVAPLTDSAGRIRGVIECSRDSGSERFDAGAESLLLAIASHVSVAVERARQTAVSIESERLAAGLKLASEIQMRMLPTATVSLSENAPFEMHAYIRPATMVGGDLYDFARSGDRLYFCIGDVSGKGLASALVMALTKTLFRANVPYFDDAAKLTEAVNIALCEETGPTMFVTAFCGFLDLQDGTLRFCNAGHDRPFLLRRDGSVGLFESRPGLALGVMPKFTYPLQQTAFAPGDALFLYTDGVTEATNASEELFTIHRVRETLERCSRESAARILEAAIDAVDAFVDVAPQADDIAMMCIRYLGPGGAGA